MRLVLVVVAMGLTACGSTVADNGSPSSSTTGSTGGGGQGPGGGGGGPDPNIPDHEALENCGSAACPIGFAQRIEGGIPATMHDIQCIASAMRDRTSGLYHVELNHTWSNGGASSTRTLFITPSGAVEVAQLDETWDEFHGFSMQTYHPTERCSLKPASFFEACLTAVSVGELPPAEAWDCVYPDSSNFALPWFDNCVAQPPTCQ